MINSRILVVVVVVVEEEEAAVAVLVLVVVLIGCSVIVQRSLLTNFAIQFR